MSVGEALGMGRAALGYFFGYRHHRTAIGMGNCRSCPAQLSPHGRARSVRQRGSMNASTSFRGADDVLV
jgi:hypothetical protein